MRQVLGTTNRGKRNYKEGQLERFRIGTKNYKSGKKRFQMGAEITNQSKGDYKPGQKFQIGAGLQIGAEQGIVC